MQCITFESGGFVLHKVRLPNSDRTFSAWYNKEGRLVDAEAKDKTGRYRPVLPMNAPKQWAYLDKWGVAWAHSI